MKKLLPHVLLHQFHRSLCDFSKNNKTLILAFLLLLSGNLFSQAPANDLCTDAIAINCGDTVTGNTTQATNTGDPMDGCGATNGAPGVWYNITGNGDIVTLSLCNSDFDTKIRIYSGTCDALTCIDGNDDECGVQSELSIITTVDENYLVYVFGFGTNTGDFELVISCEPYVTPQECLDADPFCSMEGLIFENESGDAVAPPNIDYECLNSQPDPSWFYLQIEEGGDLAFEIIQNTSFDSQGNPNGEELDVDFIAWGPFPDRASGCDNLNPSTSIDCSFLPDPVETFSIPNAMAGEVYILLITNFSQDPGFISLQQTNFGEPGTGTTDCDIVFDCAISINDGDQTVCGVDSLTLTTTTNGPIETYQWFLNDVIIDGETNSSIVVSETGNYKVIANGVDCDSPVEDTAAITFLGVDIMTNLPSTLDVCTAFEPLDATPTNPGVDLTMVTYEWKNTNGDVLSTDAMYSPTDIGTLMVIVTVPPCSTETFTIEVEATSSLNVAVDQDFKTCPGEMNSLTATTDTQGATFQWFLNGDPISGATESTLDFAVASGTTGTQTYSVVITAGLCTGTDSVDVSLYDIANCIISEGLSPNGSPGFNDSLDLEFLADRTGVSQVQIFNRLGRLVFQQNNYINEWRGQSDDGNDLPSGTYYYVIDFGGDDPLYGRQTTGWIYLNQEAK